MALQNGDQLSTEQLLHAQAHVWNHLFSFISSMSLKCALELGIPDIIHNHAKPITLSELVHALPIPAGKSHFVYRLMRILIHSEFFVRVADGDDDGEEHYWLTPASLLLLRNSPLSMTPFFQLMLDPVMMKPFDHISEWLGSEKHSSAFELVHGRSLFEYVGQEAGLNKLLNQATSSDSRLFTHVLLRDYKQVLEGITSLVDVGGGTGTTAEAIAEAFPDMKCFVLDLPHVVGGLKGTNNLTYIAGDMFEAIPSVDAVLFKWVMHDWDDESCLKMLKKSKEAIGGKDKTGGKVMIVDMVLDVNGRDNKEMETCFFFDIALMPYLTGRERTEKEWAKLFFDAGFTNYKITPAFGLRSLIEVYP
ncbi:chavicol O-methyltransferase-like [Sesamum indicum]|uniref:Chavicol O-methyltransferase-like n=1 Tax=Sesamum indicum TaxID=4182 RepID=A0A6I9T144_SESIN|nr:chavicol O-methyltransferase-like [Sesamum indicum]